MGPRGWTALGPLCALALIGFTASSAQAAFPGANGKIAFDRFSESGGSFDVFSVNPDGSGVTPLAATPADEFTPSWSPDGTRIVYQLIPPASSDSQIWVMGADGGNPTQLTAGPDDRRPAFTGDGTRIVFERSERVWIMNADGSSPVQVGGVGPKAEREPVVSPDSSTIAFVQYSFGESAIATMGIGGASPTPLTDPLVTSSRLPDISPDGSRIAYSDCPLGQGGFCSSPTSIRSIPIGGGAPSPVTDNPSFPGNFDEAPAYSPDGTQIVFDRSFPDESQSLELVPAGGGAVTPLVPGNNPDWQPLPRAPADAGAAAGAAATPDLGRCFGRDVTIRGTSGNDTIRGTSGPDVVHGLRGRDLIEGLAGDDVLCGGRGKDRIFGNEGDDVLIGGAKADYLDGGPGRNRLFGGTPNAPPERNRNVCVVGPQDSERNCQVIK